MVPPGLSPEPPALLCGACSLPMAVVTGEGTRRPGSRGSTRWGLPAPELQLNVTGLPGNPG